VVQASVPVPVKRSVQARARALALGGTMGLVQVSERAWAQA
jgi:hypothetical protein